MHNEWEHRKLLARWQKYYSWKSILISSNFSRNLQLMRISTPANRFLTEIASTTVSCFWHKWPIWFMGYLNSELVILMVRFGDLNIVLISFQRWSYRNLCLDFSRQITPLLHWKPNDFLYSKLVFTLYAFTFYYKLLNNINTLTGGLTIRNLVLAAVHITGVG